MKLKNCAQKSCKSHVKKQSCENESSVNKMSQIK